MRMEIEEKRRRGCELRKKSHFFGHFQECNARQDKPIPINFKYFFLYLTTDKDNQVRLLVE
jgi:hypothetical protein